MTHPPISTEEALFGPDGVAGMMAPVSAVMA